MIDSSFCNMFATVIIYNKSIKNSITISKLLDFNISNLTIIIVDNSTLDYNNKRSCEKNKLHYISMSGNKGLSIAYNAAIDYVLNLSNLNDIIIWFDDDTCITEDYFVKLNESLKLNDKSDVYAPIIYGQDGKIYSPNKSNFLKNILMKSPDDKIDYTRFNAINSCLAVKVHVYKKYRYNEDLFLDSVDENLFYDLRNMKFNFCLLHTCIVHNFSQRGENIIAAQMNQRLKIRIKDLMTFSRKNITYTILGLLKSWGWGVILGWRCKSVKLFFNCLAYAIIGFCINILIFLGIKKHKVEKISGFSEIVSQILLNSIK